MRQTELRIEQKKGCVPSNKYPFCKNDRQFGAQYRVCLFICLLFLLSLTSLNFSIISYMKNYVNYEYSNV